MRVVVADTGPLHYLVLIGQIELLPALFASVTVPSTVHAELLHPAAPQPVRSWAARPPGWLIVAPSTRDDDPVLQKLDEGEAAAITLALCLNADLVLMDDRPGVVAARCKGLTVIGTIGVLDLAAGRKLVDIAEAVARLKATNFRYRPELLDSLLDQHGEEKDGS